MTPDVSLPVSGKSILNKRHIFVAQRLGYCEVVLSVTEGAKTALGWWSPPTCTTPVYVVVLTRPWTDLRWAGTWRTRWETWSSLHTNGKAPSAWNTACGCWQRRVPGNGVVSRGFRVGKHSKFAAGNGCLVLAPLMHAERRVGVRGWCLVGLVFGPRLWQVLVIISPCPI